MINDTTSTEYLQNYNRLDKDIFFDVPTDDEEIDLKSIKRKPKEVNKKPINVLGSLKKYLSLLPVLSFIGLIALWFVPYYDFLRGMMATVLLHRIVFGLKDILIYIIEKNLDDLPEQGKFEIPDYENMDDIGIPEMQEFELSEDNIKIYEGWMNEIFDYDPEKFNTRLLKPIYVKLQGSILTLAATLAKIPARAVWNEVIDYSRIQFVNFRTYNLRGCYVTLLPPDIPRRRYFNRKLPIKITIDSRYPKMEYTPNNLNNNSHKFALNKKSKSDTSIMSSKAKLMDYNKFLYKSYSDVNLKSKSSDETLYMIPNDDLYEFKDPSSVDDSVKLSNSAKLTESVKFSNIEVMETLYLFGRTARQKEDWYRRFVAASIGNIYDNQLVLPNLNALTESQLKIIEKKKEIPAKAPTNKYNFLQTVESYRKIYMHKPPVQEINDQPEINFQGLLINASAGRNQDQYIKFMSTFQKACQQNKIPLFKNFETNHNDVHRKLNRKAYMLWKGIDLSLFLGPSGSVVWANVLMGRFIYGLQHDKKSLEKVRELFQKKLTAVKLPAFIENLTITSIDLGTTPPLIHRVSQPLLDERGIWVDADVTYEGLSKITISTELNLTRLKRTQAPAFIETHEEKLPTTVTLPEAKSITSLVSSRRLESSSSSSDTIDSESDSDNEEFGEKHNNKLHTPKTVTYKPSTTSQETTATVESATATTENGSQKTIDPKQSVAVPRNVKFLDRFTELSYIKRAMQNMSATLTLKVDIKGVVGRATINMPPPPSDRIWFGFRGPPRLWMSVTPTYGDKKYNWHIVKKVIESQICKVINKLLVYPNLADLSIPMLGRASYREDE